MSRSLYRALSGGVRRILLDDAFGHGDGLYGDCTGGREGRIRASAAGVLAELAAGKCAAADKVVLRERLAHEIARGGVRDHTLALHWAQRVPVDIACMLVWFATLIRPGLFA